MRYLEWDFDSGMVSEYRREGECNGCGACCRATIQYGLVDIIPLSEDAPPAGPVGSRTDQKGVWIEVQENGWRWLVKHLEIQPEGKPCPLLKEDNRCEAHDMKNVRRGYLPLCDLWPMSLSHVVPFMDCSYSFEKIGEGPFDDFV